MSEEFELIVYLCGLNFNEWMPVPKSLEEQKIDWDKLYELSVKHKVSLLVFNSLKRIPTELIDEKVYLRFNENSFFRLKNNLSKTQELLRLSRLLGEENIPIVAYKGVSFAHRVYKNIGLRNFNDIDFYFDYKKLDDLIKVFLKDGYSPEFTFSSNTEKQKYFSVSPEYNFFKKEKGSKSYLVEPHWLLISRLFAFDLKYQRLESYIEEINLGQQKINVFQLDFLPIILTIHHGVKDNWSELKFFCDWAFLIKNQGENINWNRTLEIAKEYEITDYLIKSCTILHRLFGMDLPSELMSKITKYNNNKEVKAAIKGLEQKGTGVRGNLYYRIFLRFLRSSYPIKKKILYRLLKLFFLMVKVFFIRMLGHKN